MIAFVGTTSVCNMHTRAQAHRGKESCVAVLYLHLQPRNEDHTMLLLMPHFYLACRLDNLVLDGKDRGNILAILDWELSTLGHPTADLAYSAMPYYLPLTSDDTGLPALPRNLPEGVPAKADKRLLDLMLALIDWPDCSP